MMEQYNTRPQDFTREVISHGSFVEMRKLEMSILRAARAPRDPMFYNKTYGDGILSVDEEVRSKMSVAKIGKPSPRRGVTLSEDQRTKISRNGTKDRTCVTNGVINKMVKSLEDIPDGWRIGRTFALSPTSRQSRIDKISGRKASEETRRKLSEARSGEKNHNKGKFYITNGSSNKMIYPNDEIPDGWYRGRYFSPDHKQAISDAKMGHVVTNDTREKIRSSLMKSRYK